MSKAQFVNQERLRQGAFFGRQAPTEAIHPAANYRLAPDRFFLNLAPSIQDGAQDYFERYRITWHQHANHGLSSQVCCLNFLMPLATRPDLLAKVVGHVLGIAPPQMEVIEPGAFGEPWFVGFEWIGRANYLGEWPGSGVATRGANATSADAVVRFRHEGRTETLLIEWKYTESYGQPIPPSGNATRISRYADKAFAPDGPIRADLGLTVADFFYEPFYQLLRQQMLAQRMERAREDGADRVRVLHISPTGNRSLHAVTAPAFQKLGGTAYDDAFAAFAACLAPPPDGEPRFIGRTTEQAFGPLVNTLHGDPWAKYLADRYTFLTPAPGAPDVRE
jgi:hypothetical protein